MPNYQRFCERCQRVTRDGHLWCSDKDCPAERGYPVFDYGDFVGDLKITRVISVWRSAALYEAVRGEQTVWVKIAHAGAVLEDRLKREAAFLKPLAPRVSSGMQTFFAEKRLNYLAWMPPFPVKSKQAFGEITVDGQTRVISVFAPLKGSLLRDVLLENPDIWHVEAAWITSTVAEAMKLASGKNLLHLGLTPSMIWVDKDSEGHWRPTLLDFGWLLDKGQIDAGMYAEVLRGADPTCCAPELAANAGAAMLTAAADTYALGMILHKMMAGDPSGNPSHARDDSVRQRVVANRAGLALNRPELPDVKPLVERAIAPRERYASVGDLRSAINKEYSAPPIEKRPVPMRFYLAVTLLGTTLAGVIAFGLLVLARTR